MYFYACYSLVSVKSYLISFLTGIDDESTDIFCRLILFCLCTILIRSDRIIFHTPFCCSFWNRKCADDFVPYFFGISAHLQQVVRTKNIPFTVVLSSHPGLPVLTGFGRCGAMVSHCLSVNSL